MTVFLRSSSMSLVSVTRQEKNNEDEVHDHHAAKQDNQELQQNLNLFPDVICLGCC